MQARLNTLLVCITLLMAGCASFPVCQASKSVHVYEAAHIEGEWINYVWVEIPSAATVGTFPGRLFVTSGDPVGAIIPTMIDLPCQVSSPKDAVDLSPAPVEIEFKAADDFKTSYPWRSCAPCSDCYMVWTFSLDLQGHTTEGFLDAKMVLNETFHQYPMTIVNLKMPEVTQSCTQPHISCRAGGECREVRFEPRQ